MIEDKLTKLQDRGAFMVRLKRQCEQALNMGSLMGLIVVDVRRFSHINQAFGFKAGDALLVHFAKLLGGIARKRDLVARLGDDEFALILPSLMNEGHAVLAAAKLFRELEVPLEVGGQQIRIKAHAGIAVCPRHASHFEQLLNKAQAALVQARSRGESYVLFDSEDTNREENAADLEFELENAIAGGEFELFYQPQFDVKSMKPVGAEALMRWQSPFRGAVSPDEFIEVAEQTGLITRMTQWAINTALREAKEWPTRFGKQSIAVNLSAVSLRDPNIIDLVNGCMAIWESSADALVLEVTETSAMADPKASFQTFKQLKESGVRISLDDFGTGYSSLVYFRDVPADELKLDRIFVSRMVENKADLHIATLVVQLAHRFGMKVVAEGVEDAKTYELLARIGCDFAQGYFISKPMRHRDYIDWLNRYEGLTKKGPRLSAPTRSQNKKPELT